MAVFFSVVSKMVSNIDIFQGIVSKLEIPVSWQHYYQVLSTYTVNEHTFQKANNSPKKNFLLVLWSILICWDSELVGFLLNVSLNHHN